MAGKVKNINNLEKEEDGKDNKFREELEGDKLEKIELRKETKQINEKKESFFSRMRELAVLVKKIIKLFFPLLRIMPMTTLALVVVLITFLILADWRSGILIGGCFLLLVWSDIFFSRKEASKKESNTKGNLYPAHPANINLKLDQEVFLNQKFFTIYNFEDKFNDLYLNFKIEVTEVKQGIQDIVRSIFFKLDEASQDYRRELVDSECIRLLWRKIDEELIELLQDYKEEKKRDREKKQHWHLLFQEFYQEISDIVEKSRNKLSYTKSKRTVQRISELSPILTPELRGQYSLQDVFAGGVIKLGNEVYRFFEKICRGESYYAQDIISELDRCQTKLEHVKSGEDYYLKHSNVYLDIHFWDTHVALSDVNLTKEQLWEMAERKKGKIFFRGERYAFWKRRQEFLYKEDNERTFDAYLFKNLKDEEKLLSIEWWWYEESYKILCGHKIKKEDIEVLALGRVVKLTEDKNK